MLECSNPHISPPGPLTDRQEQQYYAYQRFPVEPLPKGNPPSDLFEKYNTSEPLLTQLMEVSGVFVAAQPTHIIIIIINLIYNALYVKLMTSKCYNAH